ncbi:MAG TPA: hypothetical protein VFE78_01175 [Gemmataceae bacterium]|nr:hypothetical protein [Gemmataceae bacterium]
MVVLLLGLLGAVAAVALGALWLAGLHSQAEKLKEAEAMTQLAKALGEDVSTIEQARAQLGRLRVASYLLFGSALLGCGAALLAAFGRGLVAALCLLAAAAAPAVIEPKSLVFTAPLVLAGALSFLARTPKDGRGGVARWGRRVAQAGAGALAVALLGVALVTRFWEGAVPRVGPDLGPPDARGAGGSAADAAKAPSSRPDFTLTAQEIYDESVKDKEAANKKFDGKVIEVSGVVRDCKASGRDSMLLFELKKQGNAGFDNVYCVTEEKECWARHGRGQKVTLRGAWGGRMWTAAAVVRAAVVEAGPNPTVLYGAGRLATEFEADSFTLADRYGKKHLIVEGEVLKKNEVQGASSTVFLKGTAKTAVACQFGFHEREQAQGLRVGQQVKVFGELYPASDKGPVLGDCLVVTRPTTAAPPGPPPPHDPYRDTIRGAAAAQKIAGAGAGVKLVPVELVLAGVGCTMQVPEGAKVKAEDDRVEVRHGPQFGEKFVLRLSTGRADLAAARKYWLADRQARVKSFPVVTDDLVLREVMRQRYSAWESAHSFVLNRGLGHLDVRAAEDPERSFSADDCLLMIKCARTLALKPGYKPPDGLEALKKLGLRVDEADGKVSARADARFTDATLPYLVKYLPGAQELTLFSPITDEGLRHLAGLKRLRHLSVWGFGEPYDIDGSCLEHLKSLTGLEVLELNQASVTDPSLAHLRGMTGLKRLALRATPLSGAGFEALKGLTGLEELGLSGSAFSDAGLAHLAPLTNLRRLDLDRTRVTDAGLRHLAGLARLETLFLSETALTDEGLRHLRGLTSLRLLVLEKTRVSDAGLEHLTGLTKLVSVSLKGTKVTKGGTDKLKKALPRVSVD